MMTIGCCLPGGSFMPEGEAGVPKSAAENMRWGAEALLESGYDFVEVAVGMLMEPTDEEVKGLLALQQAGGFPLQMCNCFIPGDLCLHDRSKDAKREEYVKRVLARAAAFEAEAIVFGSGGARRIPDGTGLQEGLDTIRRFLTMVERNCEKAGVNVLLEPLNHSETNAINTVAEGARFVRELSLPHIRLLADANHMYRENEELERLSREADLLDHIHIAEMPGRVCPRKNGGGYLKEFAKALKASGYQKRVSVECGFTDFAKEIALARPFIQEYFMEGR